MAIQSSVGGSGLVDVLDRVLDKGIVIDAWARVSLVGIEILSIEARVVVASVDTYLRYADAIGITNNVARPRLPPASENQFVMGGASAEAALEPVRRRAKPSANSTRRRANAATAVAS